MISFSVNTKVDWFKDQSVIDIKETYGEKYVGEYMIDRLAGQGVVDSKELIISGGWKKKGSLPETVSLEATEEKGRLVSVAVSDFQEEVISSIVAKEYVEAFLQEEEFATYEYAWSNVSAYVEAKVLKYGYTLDNRGNKKRVMALNDRSLQQTKHILHTFFHKLHGVKGAFTQEIVSDFLTGVDKAIKDKNTA